MSENDLTLHVLGKQILVSKSPLFAVNIETTGRTDASIILLSLPANLMALRRGHNCRKTHGETGL